MGWMGWGLEHIKGLKIKRCKTSYSWFNAWKVTNSSSVWTIHLTFTMQTIFTTHLWYQNWCEQYFYVGHSHIFSPCIAMTISSSPQIIFNVEQLRAHTSLLYCITVAQYHRKYSAVLYKVECCTELRRSTVHCVEPQRKCRKCSKSVESVVM